MYTLKVSYGYVDEPEMATTAILGTYESLDEAAAAAEDKFDAIMNDLRGDTDICLGEIGGSWFDCYVVYGDHDVEVGHVEEAYEYYCRVSIVER